MSSNRQTTDDRVAPSELTDSEPSDNIERPAWLDTLEEIVAEIAPFIAQAAIKQPTARAVLERLRDAAQRAVINNPLPRPGSASHLLQRTRTKCDKFVAELVLAASDDNKRAAARRLRISTSSLSARLRAVKAKPPHGSRR